MAYRRQLYGNNERKNSPKLKFRSISYKKNLENFKYKGTYLTC